jgi:hypothetical protein
MNNILKEIHFLPPLVILRYLQSIELRRNVRLILKETEQVVHSRISCSPAARTTIKLHNRPKSESGAEDHRNLD